MMKKTLTILSAILMATICSGADNFVRGYDFNSATGFHTGADLEDLVTQAQFTWACFSPGNSTRLFDSTTITGQQVSGVWMAEVADGGIDNDKLADNAVTTDKILDGTIQSNDLAASVWNWNNTKPTFKVHRNSTNETLSKNATNIITWTDYDWNVESGFNITSNAFLPPRNGYYIFNARAAVDNFGIKGGAGSATLNLELMVNDATVSKGTKTRRGAFPPYVAVITAVQELTTNDYVRMGAWINDDDNRTLYGDKKLTSFEGIFIGPME